MQIKLLMVLWFLMGCIVTSQTAQALDIELRRAKWHATFKAATPVGREIVTIEPESVLEKAGLQPGDVLLAVNNKVIRDSDQWWDIIYGLRAEVETKLTFRRATQVQYRTVIFEPVPKENYPNLSTEYGMIVSDYNIRQRTILTYPAKDTPQPAIFVVGGLSCSSIEYTPGRQSNFIRSMQYLVQHADMMVMRVEKPGVGDSEGQCSKTDFLTELNGYEVALRQLKSDPRVDPNRIIVYGSSMGSALAPYLANKYQLNGVISDGTFYRSWFEHMLEIERRILSMKGDDQATVNDKINRAYIPLYYGMLLEKKSYQQVINETPLLADYNYHSPAHMYGRPVSFYHQMQDFNFAGEWSKLTVPVRIRWGTNDWIMSEYDIDMIEAVLLSNEHQDFEVVKVQGLDHWDTFHQSASDSFNGLPGEYRESLPQQLVDWAKTLNLN